MATKRLTYSATVEREKAQKKKLPGGVLPSHPVAAYNNASWTLAITNGTVPSGLRFELEESDGGWVVYLKGATKDAKSSHRFTLAAKRGAAWFSTSGGSFAMTSGKSGGSGSGGALMDARNGTVILTSLPPDVVWECSIALKAASAVPAPVAVTPEPLPVVPEPEPLPDAPFPTPDLATVPLTIWEAIALAEAGARIRRMEWEDRWLRYDGLWHLVIVNPITRSIASERLLETTDQTVEWYTGAWTVLP